ncbi:hypothetical protein LTR56_026949 [Elasticomyces elasticus]|nr:hypothetical protein LTR56_026949 [Elasticomyces elasticus]KAK3619599.1 hypothetical protein LTR22_025927 [Elasticomyces elasticus]KAK4898533.1 hypothetical protein LTR49_027810 [Elasticomyces elasticus]
MAAQKPYVVIAMGSFQTPWHYERLKTSLEILGYDASIINLPSTGGWTVVPEALTKDTVEIRRALARQIDAGRDVVLVAHSQGGVGASAATKGYGKIGPGVVHIVFVAAFLLEPGITAIEKVGGNEAPWLENKNGLQIPHRARDILYNDLPDDLAEKAASLVVPNSRTVVEQTIDYVPWNDIPCTYVICEKDRALLPAVSQWLLSSVSFVGEIVRMDAGHSPFLSMPDRLAALVGHLAGEKNADVEGIKLGETIHEVQKGPGWLKQEVLE